MSTAIYNEYALVGAIFNLVDDHGVAPAIKHVMQIDAADPLPIILPAVLCRDERCNFFYQTSRLT